MGTIFIVRHGKTNMNNKQLIMGQLNPPILKSSKPEIKKIAKTIQKQGKRIEKIYSSNLERAKNTSELISKEFKPEIKIELINDLKEIDYGDASGIKKDEAEKIYPLHKKDVNFRYPNGESFNDLYKRVINSFKKIETDNKSSIIVTHAGCIRAIISHIKNEDIQKNLRMKIRHDVIYKISLIEDKKEIEIIRA